MTKPELQSIWPLVARFPSNTQGRDFIVGDIHGAFTLLIEALRRVRFDSRVDRLFCVGDLIDRGEESARVIQFLAKPYVFAVRGNHEDMYLQMYADGEPHPGAIAWQVNKNGWGWWLNTTQQQKTEILDAMRKLPIAIEVDTPRGPVGIVHAEVAKGLSWPEFVIKIEQGDPAVTENALWGRTRLKANDTTGVAGIGRVFVGHTRQSDGATRLGNVYVIDTGAIYAELGKKPDARLTMMNMVHTSKVLVESDPVLNILNQPVEQPFGQYATHPSHLLRFS